MNIHVRENINICVVGANKYAYKYRTAKINHIMHFLVNFKFLVYSPSFFLSLVHSQSLIQDSTNRSEKTNVALFMHFCVNFQYMYSAYSPSFLHVAPSPFLPSGIFSKKISWHYKQCMQPWSSIYPHSTQDVHYHKN